MNLTKTIADSVIFVVFCLVCYTIFAAFSIGLYLLIYQYWWTSLFLPPLFGITYAIMQTASSDD